jgi:hypothetical protein
MWVNYFLHLEKRDKIGRSMYLPGHLHAELRYRIKVSLQLGLQASIDSLLTLRVIRSYQITP